MMFVSNYGENLIRTSLYVIVHVIASKSSPFTYRCITGSQLDQGNKYSRKTNHEHVSVGPTYKHINKYETFIISPYHSSR